MPTKVEEHEFPHGGRKGLDFDFDSLLDGSIWMLVKGEDFPSDTTAETFLGALSRYANQRDLRVNKDVSEDGNTVHVRVRPKKAKETPAETPAATPVEDASTESPKPRSRSAAK